MKQNKIRPLLEVAGVGVQEKVRCQFKVQQLLSITCKIYVCGFIKTCHLHSIKLLREFCQHQNFGDSLVRKGFTTEFWKYDCKRKH